MSWKKGTLKKTQEGTTIILLVQHRLLYFLANFLSKCFVIPRSTDFSLVLIRILFMCIKKIVSRDCTVSLCCLKVPKCEIFDPFFFTSINPIWVGDLRTGEKKKCRRLRQIFAILFFCYAGWVCAKNLPTQAEPAQKNVYAGWACAKKLPTQAECALKKCLRMLSML